WRCCRWEHSSFESREGGIQMGQIEIVGLGAGTLNQLPLGIYKKIIRTEKPVYVRTLDHPVIRQLKSEGVTLSSYDVTSEKLEKLEVVYREIVSDLLAAS